jgi:hypothetical protein
MTDFNIIVGVQSGDALRELNKVQQGVTNVGAATKRTTQQLQSHATAYNRTTVSMNKFGKGLAQQAGYQVADFAVQLQNGTSFLQAFGQQGSQMLAVFGPLGSVLGAVVAVGAALGTVFFKAGEAAKSASAGVMTLDEALKSIEKKTRDAQAELELLISGFETFEELTLSRAIEEQTKKIEDMVEANKKLTGQSEFQMMLLESAVDSEQTILSEMKMQLRALQSQVDMHANIKKFGDSRSQNQKEINEQLEKERQLRNRIFKIETSHLVGGGRGGDPRKMSDDYMNRLGYKSVQELVNEMTKTVPKLKSEINKLTPEMESMQRLAADIGQSFESAFMGAIKGTMSVKDAFRSMAIDIIAELYRVFVVKKITGFITSTVGSFLGLPSGVATGGGRQAGGPVSARTPYVVGERGPEIMIPAGSGTIVPNNRIGGGGVTVNQTINVTTGVQQTVRNEIQTLLPQIAEASKAAVLDARRRGGSFANAF